MTELGAAMAPGETARGVDVATTATIPDART
jgi:hypothetical protein